VSINTALAYRSFGPPDVVLHLQDEDLAPLPRHLARVRMLLAPINPSDLIPITGAYRHRTRLPCTAGYEGVGVVTAAPISAKHLLGRRVLPLRGCGTWQRYLDCDPDLLIPVPDDVPDDIAARAYINPMAAQMLLKTWPVRGKTVLLTGAGSVCANLLADWSFRQGAESVSGVYRNPAHVDRLADLGVQPLSHDQLADIKTTARRADIVFDALGGPIASLILASLKPGVPFVGYGLLSGMPVTPVGEGGRLERFHLRDTLAGLSHLEWRQRFDELWPKLDERIMGPSRRFALGDWRDALAFFRESGRRQKPVLVFS
jgi:NADPH:quinone reductase-like Zn-dependent oxidoreductase